MKGSFKSVSNGKALVVCRKQSNNNSKHQGSLTGSFSPSTNSGYIVTTQDDPFTEARVSHKCIEHQFKELNDTLERISYFRYNCMLIPHMGRSVDHLNKVNLKEVSSSNLVSGPNSVSEPLDNGFSDRSQNNFSVLSSQTFPVLSSSNDIDQDTISCTSTRRKVAVMKPTWEVNRTYQQSSPICQPSCQRKYDSHQSSGVGWGCAIGMNLTASQEKLNFERQSTGLYSPKISLPYKIAIKPVSFI